MFGIRMRSSSVVVLLYINTFKEIDCGVTTTETISKSTFLRSIQQKKNCSTVAISLHVGTPSLGVGEAITRPEVFFSSYFVRKIFSCTSVVIS